MTPDERAELPSEAPENSYINLWSRIRALESALREAQSIIDEHAAGYTVWLESTERLLAGEGER